MDFSFTEEQTLLQDSLMRFVQKEYTFEKRLAIQKSSEGYSRAVWGQLAGMGVLGLPFPEEYGGFGGGGAETLIVMQAIGSGLLVEPYLATVVLGGGLVQALGDPGQKQMLSPLAEGRLMLAFAHGEPRSRYALAQVETRAAREGKGWKLSGSKAVVLHGAQADRLIVSARTGGAANDETGISLFIVDRGAAGMSVRDCRTIDPCRSGSPPPARARSGWRAESPTGSSSAWARMRQTSRRPSRLSARAPPTRGATRPPSAWAPCFTPCSWTTRIAR